MKKYTFSERQKGFQDSINFDFENAIQYLLNIFIDISQRTIFFYRILLLKVGDVFIIRFLL